MGFRNTNDLGEIIRTRRMALGMTLEDVAERVGITQGALSHIESGRRLPQPLNAARIADALGLPPDQLLELLDQQHAQRRRISMAGGKNVQRDSASGQAKLREARAYAERPIDDLFEDAEGGVSGARPRKDSGNFMHRLADQPETSRLYASGFSAPSIPGIEATPHRADFQSWRDAARWSNDPSIRIEALEALADQASEAIRTLRGMLADEDPRVRAQARRLLMELDVRLPEEER